MGACGISRTVNLPREFLTSSEIRSWSHSDDSYSGDWNTCSSLYKVHKVFDKCTDSNLKKFNSMKKYQKMVEDTFDRVGKRSCEALDLGVLHYEVWSVKKTKATNVKKPIYKTQFVVCAYDGDMRKKEIGVETTQALADKKAQKYTLERGYDAWWERTKVLVSGSEDKAKFSLVVKKSKSKPKTVKNGAIVREVHKYLVIGCAAE